MAADFEKAVLLTDCLLAVYKALLTLEPTNDDYPETFIIDRNGHVIKHYPGPVNTRIMAQIEGYIKEQEAAQPNS